MSISKTDFLSKVQEIGTCEDEARRRTLLTELTDGVSEVYDENETLSKANKSLTDSNEYLMEANTQLFQRTTSQATSSEETPPGTPPEQPKREYKNLFNDKGELI